MRRPTARPAPKGRPRPTRTTQQFLTLATEALLHKETRPLAMRAAQPHKEALKTKALPAHRLPNLL
jgi:hypothetical protein